MKFQLVSPTPKYKQSFLAGLKEFQKEGLPWHQERDFNSIEASFDQFVQDEIKKAVRRTEVLVPETELWGIVDEEYAGRISIRHELNDALRIVGGHIGYDTRTSLRGRGIASMMLREALPIAKSLGLSRVLLTCDDTNVASIRVIEKNGGALEAARSIGAGCLKRYYWITLT